MFEGASTKNDELLDAVISMTILRTCIFKYFENECTWEKRKKENQYASINIEIWNLNI